MVVLVCDVCTLLMHKSLSYINFLLFCRLSAKVSISTQFGKNVPAFNLFYEMSALCIGRLFSPFGHQDVATAVNSHEDPLGCKIPTSINYITRQKNQNLELQSGDVFFTITNHVYFSYQLNCHSSLSNYLKKSI